MPGTDPVLNCPPVSGTRGPRFLLSPERREEIPPGVPPGIFSLPIVYRSSVRVTPSCFAAVSNGNLKSMFHEHIGLGQKDRVVGKASDDNPTPTPAKMKFLS